jgi:hypothetical protein
MNAGLLPKWCAAAVSVHAVVGPQPMRSGGEGIRQSRTGCGGQKDFSHFAFHDRGSKKYLSDNHLASAVPARGSR